jgi:hypothetical protein
MAENKGAKPLCYSCKYRRDYEHRQGLSRCVCRKKYGVIRHMPEGARLGRWSHPKMFDPRYLLGCNVYEPIKGAKDMYWHLKNQG